MSLGRDGNMKEMPGPEDPRGFVVDWQLADAAMWLPDSVIDLSADQSDHEVVLSDDATVRTGPTG